MDEALYQFRVWWVRRGIAGDNCDYLSRLTSRPFSCFTSWMNRLLACVFEPICRIVLISLQLQKWWKVKRLCTSFSSVRFGTYNHRQSLCINGFCIELSRAHKQKANVTKINITRLYKYIWFNSKFYKFSFGINKFSLSIYMTHNKRIKLDKNKIIYLWLIYYYLNI